MCAAGDPGTVVRWTGRVAPHRWYHCQPSDHFRVRCVVVQWSSMRASPLLLLLLLLQTVAAQISINFSPDNLAAVAGGLGETADC